MVTGAAYLLVTVFSTETVFFDKPPAASTVD